MTPRQVPDKACHMVQEGFVWPAHCYGKTYAMSKLRKMGRNLLAVSSNFRCKKHIIVAPVPHTVRPGTS